MKKICVVTGTRAEYGLLYWVMKGIEQDPELSLQLCVTGMHLSPEFGLTYKQIEQDGFHIDKKIETLLSSDSPTGISKSIGLGIIGFAEAYQALTPDLLLVLGDRFEILAAVVAAMIAGVPVAHCHGGEATEGLIDEPIRHSITKMSHLHFTSTEAYRRRVIQLGEQPASVFNVGALGIENINKLTLLDRERLESSLGISLIAPCALITFHPVTLEHSTAEQQFGELLKALDDLEDFTLIFTKPNADTDGRIIISMIDDYVGRHPEKAHGFVSLGQLRYLSLLQYVAVVVGNSSSGLIEVPSFQKATLNIGDRQKGRIKAASVIDCAPNYQSIKEALDMALSEEFQAGLRQIVNPYGQGNPSERILPLLRQLSLEAILKKSFFTLDFEL